MVTLFPLYYCLQCFDAVGWAAGRASILQKKLSGRGAGVVICLERGAYLHMAHLMPLPLTVSCFFSKIQIGFTVPVAAHPGSPVVPEKGPLNARAHGCVCTIGRHTMALKVDVCTVLHQDLQSVKL